MKPSPTSSNAERPGIPLATIASLCALIWLVAAVPATAQQPASEHPDQSEQAEQRYTRTVSADFQDVFEDLKFAISEQNYRITGVNSIGRAINDRDQQSGPFALSSVVHFCNIQAAQQILEISRDFLLHMPCRVSLQEIGDGKILLEARLMPNDVRLGPIADDVNNMLRKIVDFAAGDW